MANIASSVEGAIAFLRSAEKLKTVLRHSWTTNADRQESVAEHTFLMALASVFIMPEIDVKFDRERVMKMILIHDLAEALTGDVPLHLSQQSGVSKKEEEDAALQTIIASLGALGAREEIHGLWHEYEERKSFESRLVKCLDCLEVILQHCLSDIKTWDINDYKLALSKQQDAHFNLHPFLRRFKDALTDMIISKVAEVGRLPDLDQEALSKWQSHRGL